MSLLLSVSWGAAASGNYTLSLHDALPISIVFAVQATQANQQFGVFFNSQNAPFKTAAQHTSGLPPQRDCIRHPIPLAELGASNTSVREFAVQDWSGTTGPLFYVSNVFFSA